MKKSSFYICTIMLIFVIAICISGTVKGQSSKKLNSKNDYYSNIEDHYVKEIKSEMSKMGFNYAGVTLTKTVDNEIYTYTLQIHHKKLDSMSEQQRSDIIKKLNLIKLGSGEFSVKTKILEYNC